MTPDELAAKIVRMTRVEVRLRALIYSAATNNCTCGGSGPKDLGYCNWCRLYHAAKEVK